MAKTSSTGLVTSLPSFLLHWVSAQGCAAPGGAGSAVLGPRVTVLMAVFVLPSPFTICSWLRELREVTFAACSSSLQAFLFSPEPSF
jgi:hypothetical protein